MAQHVWLDSHDQCNHLLSDDLASIGIVLPTMHDLNWIAIASKKPAGKHSTNFKSHRLRIRRRRRDGRQPAIGSGALSGRKEIKQIHVIPSL